MAILSVLRNGSTLKSLCKPSLFMTSAIRNGGSYDPRKMFVHPSQTFNNKFKDVLHFYLLVGLVPILSMIFYVNVTVGPSTLRAIPEDYEPKHWEYYKNPICRWFARYMYPTHQEEYERLLHQKWVHDDIGQMHLIERKVVKLRNMRQDTEDAPSFRRMPLDYIKLVREHTKFRERNEGHGSE